MFASRYTARDAYILLLYLNLEARVRGFDISNYPVIIFSEGLDYAHLGETIDIGLGMDPGKALEARAEVGLLTHNVVVRGSDNKQWHDTIEACPDGFSPGQYVNYVSLNMYISTGKCLYFKYHSWQYILDQGYRQYQLQ